jgi:hypothetical protein
MKQIQIVGFHAVQLLGERLGRTMPVASELISENQWFICVF